MDYVNDFREASAAVVGFDIRSEVWRRGADAGGLALRLIRRLISM